MPGHSRKATFGVTPNRALRAERRKKAFDLLKAGHSISEILRKVPEYPSKSVLEADMRKVLKSLVERPAIEFVALQYARQEELLKAVWDEALLGNLDAHKAARETINDQSKLLNLKGYSDDTRDNSDVAIFINSMMGDTTDVEELEE